MGGRGSSSSSSRTVANQATARPQINAQNLSQAQVDAIIDQQEDDFTIDQSLAAKQYISARDTGNGYSMSQNLNYKLENGGSLNANERFMEQQLSSAMHPLGQDTVLHRAAHSDLITALGVHNYQGMTDAQLSQALVGASWDSKSFTSTSYDRSKNPFISGSQAGGREVVMRIHASGAARGVFVNKAQAEVVLARGTHFEITGASFTGSTKYPRATGRPMREVVLDVDVW